MMKFLKVNIDNPDIQLIKQATLILRKGGVIVYPTDTCYGLGVNALNESAINNLYKIKNRDYTKPTHVVVRDWQMIEDLTYTNSLANKLFSKFLPGPLTIILNKKPHVPDTLTGNLPTLGVRIPDCKLTSQLVNQLTFPITTPSANRSGEPPPYSIEEVKKVLDIHKIDLVLDAGKLTKNPPSTIVDVTQGKIKVLREGAINVEKLLEKNQKTD